MELKQPFISVVNNGEITYGGSQRLHSRKAVRRCGCGIISALDTLMYMHFNKPGCNSAFFAKSDVNPIAQSRYDRLVLKLKKYIPTVYPFGTSGAVIALGLNVLFRRFRMPYSARCVVSLRSMWTRTAEMLNNNIPVILAVGHSISFSRRYIPLYTKQADGKLKRTARARAHFVTVTAMGPNWLRVSSWGREYYMKRADLENYAKRASAPFATNIVYIYRSKKHDSN